MVNLPKSVMILGHKIPVVVKDLGSGLHGQSFWQDIDDKGPLIEINSRIQDQAQADRTLFHEMTHIVLGITGWAAKLSKEDSDDSEEEGIVVALEELWRAWVSIRS